MAAEALAHLGRPTPSRTGWRGYRRAPRRRRRRRRARPCPRRTGRAPWARRRASRVARPLRARGGRPARRAVVGEWAPRLLPGTVGAATHGLIRTAHAVRGLGAADTPPRRLEVANGLAFWASSYQELPGPPLLIGHEGVAAGAGRSALSARGRAGSVLISDRVAAVAEIADEFEQAVASLGWTGGAVELLDQLASAARWRTCATRTTAAPSGCCTRSRRRSRRARPALAGRGGPRRRRSATPGRRWRPCTSPTTSTARPRCPTAGAQPADDLVDRALASGDEHAIKLTEAALRSLRAHRRSRALLLAAADAAARLGG